MALVHEKIQSQNYHSQLVISPRQFLIFMLIFLVTKIFLLTFFCELQLK